MSLVVRPAHEDDLTAILEVHRAAFGSEVEAQLVADLVASPDAAPLVSVVGEDDTGVVAHVLLTSGRVPQVPDLGIDLLAPLAVLPAHQNQGVGTAVTRLALDAARAAAVACVCVLGDPRYYGRFGFTALLPEGPWPPVDLAPEYVSAWQTLWLAPPAEATRAAVDRVRVQWATPFRAPELWGP